MWAKVCRFISFLSGIQIDLNAQIIGSTIITEALSISDETDHIFIDGAPTTPAGLIDGIRFDDDFVGEVTLTVKDGDGGDARVNCGAGCGNEYARGVKGRKITATFTVGPGYRDIPRGSVLRLMIGNQGTNDFLTSDLH